MTCPHCKKEYDEKTTVHVPIEVEVSRGMMTMRTLSGECKELERK